MNFDPLNQFQEDVTNVLVRHKSLLDVITKFQESCSRVNRAVVKSASNCGCIEIIGKHQKVPSDATYEEINQFLSNNIVGELCDVYRDKVEQEIGNCLFYLAAVSSTLNIELSDIMEKQWKNIKTLGKFSLY